jgi:hypothetical protein
MCDDLVDVGVPGGEILFDQWSNRPGGHADLYQNVERIVTAGRVIVVGSADLKARYGDAEHGRGVISLEISVLRTRIQRRGTDGIIYCPPKSRTLSGDF